MGSKLKKLKKNIAVLMGGYSDEFEISIKSGNNILKNIDTKLFNPYSVIIEKNNWRVTIEGEEYEINETCLLYTSPSPRDPKTSRMPSSA